MDFIPLTLSYKLPVMKNKVKFSLLILILIYSYAKVDYEWDTEIKLNLINHSSDTIIMEPFSSCSLENVNTSDTLEYVFNAPYYGTKNPISQT